MRQFIVYRSTAIRLTAAAILLASLLFLAQKPVLAQSGQAFSITPPLLELQANPGETLTTEIKLTNLSNDELLIKTQFNDFGAKNESGEPNIIFDDNQNTPYSLRQWLTPPTPFKIGSKETKVVKFPITIPKNAEPGGHYAVIRFTGTTPEMEESGVSLSASIGSLVLLQVAGDVKEKTSITEFFSATPQFSKSSFFESGPIGFVTRLKNEGNVHSKPTGTIEITDMFGRKVTSARVNGDPADSKNTPKSVLPQSIRKFEQTLPDQWLFGKYEAKLNLSYGQNQPPLTSSVTFWVIPYKLIGLALLAITALFFGLRFALRRYNAHIIAKAQAGKSGGTLKIKRK